MHEYTVVDGRAGTTRVILRHDRGDCHLAHAVTEVVPPHGARLSGSAPALGVQVLVSTTGRVYRLRFERIGYPVG